MCQYCIGEHSAENVIKSCNFGGSASLMIGQNGYMDVLGDKQTFKFFKKIYCPSFKINYCPMCGRKFEKD